MPILPYVTEIPWAEDFVRRPVSSVPFLVVAAGTVIANGLALCAGGIWSDRSDYFDTCCCSGFLATPFAGAILASVLLIVSQQLHAWLRGGGYYRRGEDHYFAAGLVFGLCLFGAALFLDATQLIHPDFAAFRTAGAIVILLIVPVLGPFFLIYRPKGLQNAPFTAR